MIYYSLHDVIKQRQPLNVVKVRYLSSVLNTPKVKDNEDLFLTLFKLAAFNATLGQHTYIGKEAKINQLHQDTESEECIIHSSTLISEPLSLTQFTHRLCL